jgi:hypothetical protein
MNTATKLLTAAFFLAGVAMLPAVAQTDDPDAYADSYQAGDYGRIRFDEGGATIVRADGRTDTGDRAGVNAPIFPGDTLRTASGGRVEVQLANGTLLRVDRDSEVAFQSLPQPGARYRDNSVMVLSRGVVRVASRVGDNDEFRLDTPDASVYVLGDGDVRIDVDPRGGTRVTSVRGVAEVVGNDGSVLVRGGTGTSVLAGDVPAEPFSATAFGTDGFDRWCSARDASYRNDGSTSYAYDRSQVPAEVQPYYGELSAYGSWVDVPTYGHVWYPHAVPYGWRPYSSGYWSYGPGGYFWVSYEPWGWAPYHYGNWQYVPAYGWCWLPGSIFAGAWVSWSWGSAYVGWAPLDYWGRPGWVGGPYYHGYYDPGCWTFVNYNHIASTHVNRYAVPYGTVSDDLRHANVVSRPPRVDPKRIADSREVRERALQSAARDRTARIRPVDNVEARPARTMRDVQTHLSARRPSRTVEQGNTDRVQIGNRALGSGAQRGQPWERPRRIVEDPRLKSQRGGAEVAERRTGPATGSQDSVRGLYERMSRPRETRPQNTTPQRQSVAPTRPSSPQRQSVAPSRPQRDTTIDRRPQRQEVAPSRPSSPQRKGVAPSRPQRDTTIDRRPQRQEVAPSRPSSPQRQSVAPSRPSSPQRQSATPQRPQGGSRMSAPSRPSQAPRQAPRSQPKSGGQGQKQGQSKDRKH